MLQMRKYEIYDKYEFEDIRISFGKFRFSTNKFEPIWNFFWEMYKTLKAASSDANFQYNVRKIVFENSIRTDPELIDPEEWEHELRKLHRDHGSLTFKDIVEWFTQLHIKKAKVNTNVRVNTNLRL